MSVLIQYDFFQTKEESEIQALRNEVERLRFSADKVRKGVFARVGEVKKIQIDMEDRLLIIEKNLCKNYTPQLVG